jgi:uncharacterized membrane protein
MALFVGGQLMLAAVVVPALRGRHRLALHVVARRFGAVSGIALAVLVVTGSAMASRDHLWGAATLHVKLALIVVVIGLIALHARRPAGRVLDGLIFLASVAIVYLGLALAHGPLPFD